MNKRLASVLLLTGCVAFVGEPTKPIVGPQTDSRTPLPAVDSGQPVADAGPVADVGPVDSGTVDAGNLRVPIFIAQGKLGRTMVSCDDGRTWVANKSENQSARCWDSAAAENIECDHNPWSSVGMVEADGAFLATYGWGYPGVVRRTEDGIHWTDVIAGHTFSGMAYGNGRIMANDHAPWVSADGGMTNTWTRVADISSVGWTVRRIGFVPAEAGANGRFIITLDDEIQLSDDNGATWKAPTTRPTGCAKNTINILTGNGATLIFQSDGSVCRSGDRGTTWTLQPVTPSFSSNAVFGNGAFYVWAGMMSYRSVDGITWVGTSGSPAGVEIGPVAVSANGTFVATRGGWQVWYEKQKFYRSADGVTWAELPPTAFVASHPITSFIFGFAKPSTECPR